MTRPLTAALPIALAALLAACGSHPREPQRCASAADCAADAFCRQGTCAASAPPVAVVTPPPARPFRSHTVLRFDGSLSHDPDPEDRVAGFAWTFRRVTAGCDPVPARATGQAADVVFGCGGAFEVLLGVADAGGTSSAPAVLPITVELSADFPTVEMGPDVAIDHRCAGSPLRCGLDAGAAPVLSAAARSPTGAAFTYAWSVALPPEREGPSAPRVILDPPDGPSPAIRIETDGAAISGEYLFTVHATDAWQLVAVGQQRVRVGNRPPGIEGGGTIAVDHGYDAASSTFTAEGLLPAFTIVDPDGDPVTPPAFAASHAGDGPGTFEVTPAGGGASFRVAVPYATPADALHLIGGAGLRRTIGLSVEDVNGGRAEAAWEVLVSNRRPRLLADLRAPAVDHGWDAARGAYVATAPLATVVDDDGDPVVQAGPTGSAVCAELAPLVGGGELLARCAQDFTGLASLGRFVGVHALSVHVADPFASLVAGATRVTIGNRSPRIVEELLRVPAPGAGVTCCAPDPDGTCGETARGHGPGSVPVATHAVDDDGDPIAVTSTTGLCAGFAPAALLCPSASCPAVELFLCEEEPACGVAAPHLIDVQATDGIASTAGVVRALWERW